jgi:hypothetical protein
VTVEAELVAAEAELKRHMASWEYAFAMGGSCHGQGEHPMHWATRAVTERLVARCRELRARLGEHEVGTPPASDAAEQL